MRRLLALTFGGAAIATLLAVAALGGTPARALPPAGSDTFDAKATVHFASRGGAEVVTLTGSVTIQRADPHMDGGVEVVDAEITALSLTGFSAVGPVTVTESSTLDSTGEVRSLQPAPDQFPASSFFDVFIDVSVPASPVGALMLHNNQALKLIASDDIDAWPPYGVTFELDPIYLFDNDGDGLIDEDTADDDGDGLIDEDRPGPDPDTPGPGFECVNDADCDGFEGEDPPAELCPPATEGTPTLCDQDGDGLIDEDPDCIPLLNPGNTHMKAGVCVREVAVLLAEPGTITPPPSPTQIITPSRTPTPTRTPTRTPTPLVMATFTPTSTPVPVFGDVNCDGRVDAIDAALILQRTAGLLPALPCPQGADVNQDGSVDSIDAAIVLQFIAGLIDTLPV